MSVAIYFHDDPHDLRIVLGKAAKSKKARCFKSVTDMEMAGREIVGPDLPQADVAVHVREQSRLPVVRCPSVLSAATCCLKGWRAKPP
ncbi:hypothetical protein [Microvirga arsenatis]|uniref:Uncharacterized protein n=1 Tax=Microvirga arsenatis TaxID=2692265 RepID=A0ABW9YYJ3_9HYPH|nr:hypothetical protein [Microvirga arsenatis]NBJ11636.1 hypothetical protein [Microvirga arsenatis]NBJ24917.1 hypothetical protein [Microvirga arsenatis]